MHRFSMLRDHDRTKRFFRGFMVRTLKTLSKKGSPVKHVLAERRATSVPGDIKGTN